jgi:hypothetical protein
MKKVKPRVTKAPAYQETEALDSLNASMHSKRDMPQLIRRSIEADIEAKARKKRSREVPASSGFKRRV